MELKLKHRFNFFPEISAEDSKGLKESISNGFDESLGKITLYEGKVLDGWNRYKACIETGVEPVFTTFYGNDMDAFNFSVNANLDRRHLTSSQKAAMAVSAEPLLEAIEKANEEERRVKQAETLKKTLAEQKAKKEREEKEIEEAIKREEVRIEREAELKKQQAAADEKRKKEIENEKIKIEEERKQEEINKLKRIEKEISLAQLIAPSTNREEKTNRETRTKLADAFGTNRQYINDAKKLKETSPELYQEVLSGKKTITEVKKEVKKDKKETERNRLEEIGKTKKIDIDFRLGDFEEVFKDIPDGSIDCIITDPPYPYEFIDVWSKLSRVAKRVLKPNGYCIAYSGQMYLPEVMQRMSQNLDYYWTFAVYHEGQTQIVNGINLMCRWKPVLIFQNGKKKIENTFQDYFISESREKNGHDWQQSKSGVGYLIEMFTKEGDTILEPFAGSGTTIICAKEKKRNIIAAELDEKTYNIAKALL